MEKTFYGEPQLKESLLRYTKSHQQADAYIRGKWLSDKFANNGSKKGCFYGCMTQSEDSALQKASEQYGLTLWYVHLTERIYEGLPEGEWLGFPYEAIKVLPIGIDLYKIRSKFYYRLLEDQLRFCKGSKEATDVVKKCMELFKVDFDKINQETAFSIAEAAWSIAGSANMERSTRSAVETAFSTAEAAYNGANLADTVEAACSAADSVLSAVCAAAYAASESLVRSVSKSNYYSWIKNMLFDCIIECCGSEETHGLKLKNIHSLSK